MAEVKNVLIPFSCNRDHLICRTAVLPKLKKLRHDGVLSMRFLVLGERIQQFPELIRPQACAVPFGDMLRPQPECGKQFCG